MSLDYFSSLPLFGLLESCIYKDCLCSTQPNILGGMPFKYSQQIVLPKEISVLKAPLKAIELPICKSYLKSFFFSFCIIRGG